jgi:hypothetical protein
VTLSPVPAALLAVLVLASLALNALWPVLPHGAGLYRALDLADRSTLLASAMFLAREAVRSRGWARVLPAAAALLAGGARFVGVRWLTLLAERGASGLWTYGVPALVAAVLVTIARRRAASGG